MWIYEMNKIAGGDVERIAWHAHQQNLTHIYVRVGSSVVGLKTLDQVGRILPAAHYWGIKVVAWYFPYFNNIDADVVRSRQAITHRFRGHTFDGFAADIETAPGSALSPATVRAYSSRLADASPGTYLIAVPPRVTSTTLKTFPWSSMMPFYDAVAPMVYWSRFSPTETVAESIAYLKRWGKPVAPIGQMYDMRSEGGPGHPPPHQIWAFIRTSKELGAAGVSFWSWQHATSPGWRALRLYPW